MGVFSRLVVASMSLLGVLCGAPHLGLAAGGSLWPVLPLHHLGSAPRSWETLDLDFRAASYLPSWAASPRTQKLVPIHQAFSVPLSTAGGAVDVTFPDLTAGREM